MQSLAFPLRLLLGVIVNAVLVVTLQDYMPATVSFSGGAPGALVLGSLLTIMNTIARPILKLIVLPLRLLMSLFASILVQLLFLWLTTSIAATFDPSLVTFAITGNVTHWVLVGAAFGLANWILRHVV